MPRSVASPKQPTNIKMRARPCKPKMADFIVYVYYYYYYVYSAQHYERGIQYIGIYIIYSYRVVCVRVSLYTFADTAEV